MNPGPVEEGAKVVTSFMDTLKQQPLSLALVVMNFALLGLFWAILEKVSHTREREMTLVYDDHKQVREILSRCVVSQPSQQPPFRLQSGEEHPASKELLDRLQSSGPKSEMPKKD